jgi:serine/threonine-protein kinase
LVFGGDIVLEPGKIFAGRYRVNRLIAEGGMGAIFEAEHTATERKVALKLLFPHIMSVASARKKFELEARISARVKSPYIVDVIDAGFDEASKSPYLAMELLEGLTLAAHVRERGALPPDQAIPLLEQVAAGLDAAHGYKEHNGTSKPIIHRDLKPENLFLANEHGAYVVKILDFGIAKVLGETGNISQEVRGTPLFMAFEQVTAGALSPQTDIWALGLIAYYMLTGSHYWRAATQQTANVQSLFAEILTLPLEAPSVRMKQRDSIIELPPAFDTWLLECIQRDPPKRFSSAGAAVEALARAFEKTPRPRGRTSVKPVALPGFSATEAYIEPAPAPPKTLGSSTSLPGVASERAATNPPRRARAPLTLPVVAGGAAVFLGLVLWLAAGGDDTPPQAHGSTLAPATAAEPAAPAPAREAPSVHEPAPAPSTGAPEPRIRVAEPEVEPAVTAATDSAPEGEPASPDPSATPEPPASSVTTATTQRPTVAPVHPSTPPAIPAAAPAAPPRPKPLIKTKSSEAYKMR